jgi:circadian clock protein KaiB
MASTKKKKPGKSKSAAIDSRAEFENLLKTTNTVERYQLRLYVTGTSPRSTQAIANIRSLCDEYLGGRYDLEVVDIYQQPTEAADQQIIAAPTLIQELPNPPKRLVGNLSDRDKVIVGLNLHKKAEATKWIAV